MAGYTIYELLETLIQRVAWPSESERSSALESVQQYREVSLFGNMATLIECPHDEVSPIYSRHAENAGICVDCHRRVTNVGGSYV